MLKTRRRLPVAALGTLLLALAGATALAQEGNTLGPPQLRDFQLKGERRTPPAQPQPTAPEPAPAPAPAERTPAARPETTPRAAEPRQERAVPDTARPSESEPRAPSTVPAAPQDVFQLPSAVPEADRPQSQDAAPPAAPDPSTSLWYYLAPAGLALLGGFFVLRRRRRVAAEPVEAALPAEPARPRPEPIPRPWLELELKAERAASTDAEASVEFEMVIRNTGKSSARNIRVNARMFNAGREQDKEIGAFFKTKGEGRRTYTIPELPAGERGLVQGTVTMPRDDMRALKVNEQLLFIPVVGVNAVYDWGNGRTGQTSKSYVIGRELGDESDKMGAFRLDLGPRIYRTVGQRQHSLAKRV